MKSFSCQILNLASFLDRWGNVSNGPVKYSLHKLYVLLIATSPTNDCLRMTAYETVQEQQGSKGGSHALAEGGAVPPHPLLLRATYSIGNWIVVAYAAMITCVLKWLGMAGTAQCFRSISLCYSIVRITPRALDSFHNFLSGLSVDRGLCHAQYF